MKSIIKNFVSEISKELADTMNESGIFWRLLDAYNQLQEKEHDGVDYIFNLYNHEDLAACVKGGLGPKEISDMYHEITTCRKLKFFLFGQNYDEPKQFTTYGEIQELIVSRLDEIILNMLDYPESYEFLYDAVIGGKAAKLREELNF